MPDGYRRQHRGAEKTHQPSNGWRVDPRKPSRRMATIRPQTGIQGISQMIARTFNTARTPGPTRGGMKSRALFSALLGCLAWLPLSSAEAVPFQQYRNGTCASALICTIDFPVLLANRRLDITNVSCYLRTSGNHEFKAMQLLVMQAAATRSALTLAPSLVDLTSNPFEAVYAANHPIVAYAGAGQRFQVYAELHRGTFSQFACHISGQLQVVP
jgi:hypothetical protein